MSKRNYLGGLLGAQTSRQGSFTDPGDVTRYVPNVGMLSLGEAAVEGLSTPANVAWSNASDSRLVGSNIGSGDQFGASCAISGDGSTLVISDYNGQEAYVYVDGVETAILTGSDTQSGDRFGISVAISGDGSTIIVGADGWFHPSYSYSVAIYVYEKPGGGWANATEDAILNHTDMTVNGDSLGQTLAISDDGSIIAAGEMFKNSTTINKGAIQVYTRPGAFGTWVSSNTFARLTASDASVSDLLSVGLAISGDGTVIAAGAPYQDDTLSSAGKMYVFEKPGGGWATATEDHSFQYTNVVQSGTFGMSCALNTTGDLLAVGIPSDNLGSGSEGSVRVFSYSTSTWTEIATLRGLDAGSGDQVGNRVNMTRDGQYIVAVAATYDGDYDNQGAIYVWEKTGGGWANSSSPTRLTDSNVSETSDLLGATTAFGHTIGISNDGVKIIAGARNADVGGVAVLFDRASTTTKDLPMLPWGGITGRDVFSLVSVDLGEGWNWTETALVGSDISASGDYCGADSAMSGDGSIIVAGSDSTAKNKVYVFENGTQVAELTASDTVGSDRFGAAGIAVSNDGNTIAVGAFRWDSGGSYTDGGAIYVYEKPGGGWANATEDARLSDGTQERNADYVGSNISISSDGSTIVASSQAGTASLVNAGAGIVYVRPGAAGTWANSTTPTATLTRSTRASSDDAYSVAISQDGSTIAVGFSSADVNGTNNGVVCIYDKPGGGWANATEDHVLQPDTIPTSYHLFGRAVSLSSDGTYMAAVSRNDVFGRGGYSTAYLFSTNGTTWTEDATLSMEEQDSQYAESVAITSDGSRVIAAAWGYTDTVADCGCIYVWDKPASGWADKDYDQIITADTQVASGYLGRNLYTSSNNLGITNDGKTITVGYYTYNGTLGAVLELSGLPTPGNAVNVVDIADMTTTGILGLSDHYTALNRA